MLELEKINDDILEQVEEEKKKVFEQHPKIKIQKIEVRNEETDEMWVGWFKSPMRSMMKKIQGKFGDKPFEFSEAIFKDCIIFPDRRDVEDFLEYNFGIVSKVSAQLLKLGGLDGNGVESKKNYTQG